MSIHSLLRTSDPAAPVSGLDVGSLNAVTKPPLAVGDQSDCCCAAAQVRIVLPPAPGRSGRPELLMCAHHFRKSAAKLATAGADVYDAQGNLLTGNETFWAETSIRANQAAAQPA